MSGLAIVVVVISSIFAAGVLLGVTSVISLSAAQRGTWRNWDVPHQFAGPRVWWGTPPAPESEPAPPAPDVETLQDSDDYPGGTRAWPRDGHWG